MDNFGKLVDGDLTTIDLEQKQPLGAVAFTESGEKARYVKVTATLTANTAALSTYNTANTTIEQIGGTASVKAGAINLTPMVNATYSASKDQFVWAIENLPVVAA